jgi:hypothetical protein
VIIPSRPRAFSLALAAAAALGGVLAAIYFHRIGLTLSHYDARGHLVVARRIFDSLTPGWQQIGAVWLPLPHLLNAVPAQSDFLYRTGAFAVAISIASFALTVSALAELILLATGSRWAAVAGVSAFALNPNVLYLQSTPMTEPLSIGLMTLAVAMLTAWCAAVAAAVAAAGPNAPLAATNTRIAIGGVFALACLTRYEVWPVTASALALAVAALCRSGLAWREAVRAVASIASLPAFAIIGFALLSRAVLGEWFVAGGFFVPENAALGRPVEALAQIGWGLRALSDDTLLTMAAIGFTALAIMAVLNRSRAWLLVALSLVAAASVPWAAFVNGHPYRIRYMVPLVAAEALGIGIAAGLARRAAPIAALLLVSVSALELRAIDTTAPMVVEAQWDRPNAPARQEVTECLQAGYAGDTVMASMGSLGHYMQELASAGFAVTTFLHEGNGDIWLAALQHPRPYAGWILIEELAEGGDVLARAARERPHFLDGYSRTCEGAGLALYRRK